jgi:hypothetical protein
MVWPRETGFSQLPSAVINTVNHPSGSPSLMGALVVVLPVLWNGLNGVPPRPHHFPQRPQTVTGPRQAAGGPHHCGGPSLGVPLAAAGSFKGTHPRAQPGGGSGDGQIGLVAGSGGGRGLLTCVHESADDGK